MAQSNEKIHQKRREEKKKKRRKKEAGRVNKECATRRSGAINSAIRSAEFWLKHKKEWKVDGVYVVRKGKRDEGVNNR